MPHETAMQERADVDRAHVERNLQAIVDRLAAEHEGMKEAVAYSLLGGGKRLRPLLCLWTHDAFGGHDRRAALEAACAVECVHAYSLVHDDLPCMDDDDLRRGRPSTHRRFGEANAVLAGDALLNLAYLVLARMAGDGVAPGRVVEAIDILATASGTAGLITGQALDMSIHPPADGGTVDRIHAFKTGRLIAAAMEMGALFAGGDAEVRDRVRHAGGLTGSAFQIVDDVLDVEGTAESLGKTPGKDVDEGKATYPSAVGLESARRTADERIEAALAALPEADGTPLAALLRYIVRRSS